MIAWLERWYGAGPRHLVAMGAGLAVSGYAAWRLIPRNPVEIAAWIIAGPLIHDLVLVSLYAGVLLVLGPRRRVIGVRGLNHLCIPALLSGVMFLVFFPLILRRPPAFEGITGFTTEPYLGNWLVLTAVLYLVSGLVYLAKKTSELCRLRFARRT